MAKCSQTRNARSRRRMQGVLTRSDVQARELMDNSRTAEQSSKHDASAYETDDPASGGLHRCIGDDIATTVLRIMAIPDRTPFQHEFC